MSASPYTIRQKDGVCCTMSANAALEVLLSEAFGPLKIPTYYERLARELGRDFPNIRFVAGFIPLLHSGQRHRVLRQQSAIFLHSRAEALAAFERNAAALVKQKLGQPGRVEMVAEIIEPIFKMAAEAITGLPYFPDVFLVFTTNNSLKMTNKIDSDFAELRKMAWARFPDDSADTHAMRVMLSTQGIAPIGAGLAASFAGVLAHKNATPICDLKWGDHYIKTGLVMVGRESVKGPVNLGEGASAVRVCEVDMRSFLAEGGQPNHIFGAGAHACLGRAVALALWLRIGADLAQNTLKIRLLEKAAPSHKILEYPGKMLVEVFA